MAISNTKISITMNISLEDLFRVYAFAHCRINFRNPFNEYFSIFKEEDGLYNVHIQLHDCYLAKYLTSKLFSLGEVTDFLLDYIDFEDDSKDYKVVMEYNQCIMHPVKKREVKLETETFQEFKSEILRQPQLIITYQEKEIPYADLMTSLFLSNDFDSLIAQLAFESGIKIDLEAKDLVLKYQCEDTLYEEVTNILLKKEDDRYIAKIHSETYDYTRADIPVQYLLTDYYHDEIELAFLHECLIDVRYVIFPDEPPVEMSIPRVQAYLFYGSDNNPMVVKHEDKWVNPCELCAFRLRKEVSGCLSCQFKPKDSKAYFAK